MAQCKIEDFPIGKKIFARYSDEFNDLQINFIPIYILEEKNDVLIGTKNNMVGTEKGYFNLFDLTGTEQISAKFLSNIYLKKKAS